MPEIYWVSAIPGILMRHFRCFFLVSVEPHGAYASRNRWEPDFGAAELRATSEVGLRQGGRVWGGKNV